MVVIYIQELYPGAHSDCCVVTSAAVGLLLGLRDWHGCLPVAQWVDSSALKCAPGLCASACHLDDLVTLHCSAMICGAATHLTPPPPGARLMCHWHINLIV